ncbi:two-component system chemotaxis sensor kinase CheA [Silvimonas terrae]|uniref:Chemotaxis protein CheA n=1 Tax=Silvimonas terrae TaxID=300266 RepID=A0A840RE93_9NEIS|nr:response regulator [Silvimonas terrae]MBB5190746.1 two-component system chemotaxis sensor kinase CheA [Silvimonas terrae]
MAKDPYRFFRIEARELVDQLSSGIIALEGTQVDPAVLARLLRLAHTLKGAARVVKQGDIADLAHAVEDDLAPWREGGQIIAPGPVGQALRRLDAIDAALASLPGTTEDAVASPIPARQSRTDPAEVNELLDGLGEIGRELTSLSELGTTIAQINNLAGALAAKLDGPHAGVASVLADLAAGAARNLSASTDRIDRELRQARDTTERLRLVSAASLFSTLERTARDAAQSVGKQVSFEASGGEAMLDGQVLDIVQNALVQLVRNAVAHGIELPGERIANGKPPAGQLRLRVARQGYQVAFHCTDDGKGIDFDAVRAQAIRQGHLPPTSPTPDTAALVALLFKGGLSTSGSLTQIAGRGIGLDVVREAAQQLNGNLRADTSKGSGTEVILTVPVSLAAMDALLVDLDNQRAAIPLDAVRATQRLSPAEIARTGEGETLLHEAQLIPLLSPRLFNDRPAVSDTAMSAVILAGAQDAIAIKVDRLVGTQSIVLRPLPAFAPADPVILGSYLDNEGTPCLVLDPTILAATPRQHGVASPGQMVPALPILVVDDSLTTRMLEESILSSAGLPVATAASAEEALEMMQQQRYALFLVDVEMPGMDGFTLVQRIRADPQQHGTPCILVTSCNSDEDRRRGERAGAAAYIVKGEFDQVDFLRRVRTLVQS